jgi:hypothetical protein
VDARDAAALRKVIEMTGAAALVTNPPYGRGQEQRRTAELVGVAPPGLRALIKSRCGMGRVA